MDKLLTYLVSAAIGVAALVGGVVLGNVLRDDSSAPVAAPSTAVIGAAALADPDSGPDGSGQVELPRPSARRLPADRVIVGTEDGDAEGGLSLAEIDRPVVLGGLYSPPELDPDDPDTPRVPQEPPTMPGGLDADGVGIPDPDLPPVVADGVVELDLDELLGSIPDDDPSEELLGDPPFFDPCADVDDDERDAADEICPEGVGGTIVLPTDGGSGPPDPLTVMTQLHTSTTSSVELRCPDLGLGADGVYRVVLASNNPADFSIRYWPTATPSVTRSTSARSTDSELGEWVARRAAGEPVLATLHHGVHTCLELDGLEGGQQFALDLQGIDDFGSTLSVRMYGIVDDGGGVRPPVTFQGLMDTHVGLLVVPFDVASEYVIAEAIPRTGPRASERSCTEVEGDVLDRRHTFEPALSRLGTTSLSIARPGVEFDARYDTAATYRLYGSEGTRYQLCVWVLAPAERSFDRPDVNHRASFLVRAPRHLRVRVSLVGGHADLPLDPNSVRVSAESWPQRATAFLPLEPQPATAFMMERPRLLFESAGYRVSRSTILEVEGPTGNTQLLEVPTPTRCFRFIGLSSCPERTVKQYDVPIPGRIAGRGLCGSSFGSCDPPREQTYVGNLRLMVETYSGPSGPPTGGPEDGWQVFDHGRFDAADGAELPPTPQVDSLASHFRALPPPPGPPGLPQLQLVLEFDRPVQVDATPVSAGAPLCRAAPGQTTSGFQSTVVMGWSDACRGAEYTVSLLAVDEDGNELDFRTEIDGVPRGGGGWGYARTPGVDIVGFTAELQIDRLGDGVGIVSAGVLVGGVSIDRLVDGDPGCVLPDRSRTFRFGAARDEGSALEWGDLVRVEFEVQGGGDGVNCGVDRRYPRVVVIHDFDLESLLLGPASVGHSSDLGDVTLRVTSVTLG